MRKSFLLLRKSFLDLDIYFLSIIGKKINILRLRKTSGLCRRLANHNLSPFVSIKKNNSKMKLVTNEWFNLYVNLLSLSKKNI